VFPLRSAAAYQHLKSQVVLYHGIGENEFFPETRVLTSETLSQVKDKILNYYKRIEPPGLRPPSLLSERQFKPLESLANMQDH